MSNGKKYSPKSAIKLTLGGFVLSTHIKGGHDNLVVESVAGDWRVVWSDETSVYRLVLGVLATDTDGTAKDYVHKWLSMVYMASMTLPDGEMVVGYDKLVLEYMNRNRGDAPELSKEEMDELAANTRSLDAAYNGGLGKLIDESEAELEAAKERGADNK